jgi:hypothetical protein
VTQFSVETCFANKMRKILVPKLLVGVIKKPFRYIEQKDHLGTNLRTFEIS